MPEKINFADKFSLFDEQWKPKIIADVDDYEVRIAKIEGDFVWHSHEDADEMFIVIKGTLDMDFRDRRVIVEEGEMVVVPKGTEHKPHAANECCILMIEKAGTANTGDGPESDRTAPMGVRI